MALRQAFVALGSNLENPQKQVEEAVQRLHADFPRDFQQSPLFFTTPLGPQDQPDYVNAVVTFKTDLNPFDLLAQLQAMEKAQGKVKKRHWGERIIDLDLLLVGDMVIHTHLLKLPHPGLLLRDFVVEPLKSLLPHNKILVSGSCVDISSWQTPIQTLKETL